MSRSFLLKKTDSSPSEYILILPRVLTMLYKSDTSSRCSLSARSCFICIKFLCSCRSYNLYFPNDYHKIERGQMTNIISDRVKTWKMVSCSLEHIGDHLLWLFSLPKTVRPNHCRQFWVLTMRENHKFIDLLEWRTLNLLTKRLWVTSVKAVFISVEGQPPHLIIATLFT